MEDLFKKLGKWGFERVGVNPKTGNVVAYFTNAVKYGRNLAPENEENLYRCSQGNIKLLTSNEGYLPEYAALNRRHTLEVFERGRKAIQDYKTLNGIALDTPPVDLESLPSKTACGMAENDDVYEP